jgi:hypothetical protein
MSEYGCRFLSKKYKCTNESNRFMGLTRRIHNRVPHNTSILFFGTSLLGQIVDSILCHNTIVDAVDHRTHEQLDNRFTMSHKSWLPSECKNSVCNTHEFATYRTDENATVTSVINWPNLQRFSRIENFRRLLETNRYDYVFMMLPHPECFFDWLKNKSKPFCVNTNNYHPEERRVIEYQRVVGSANVKWYTVRPWNQKKNLRVENHTITLMHVTKKYGLCGYPSCSNTSNYHQCMPGNIPLFTKFLVDKMFHSHRPLSIWS